MDRCLQTINSRSRSIPGKIAEQVVSKTEEVLLTENKVRNAILGGMDPQEAYLKFGKF